VAARTVLGLARPCPPREAAVDHPAQDDGPPFLQMKGQAAVAFSLGDGDREGDQVHAPAYGRVDVAKARLVVAGDPELERRAEGEPVLAHVARGHRAAACHLLDLALGPATALLRLARRHKARDEQFGEVGRELGHGRGHEGLHGRRLMMGAHHARQRRHELALAVLAEAVEEEKRT
jgi:hypothetical protein